MPMGKMFRRKARGKQKTPSKNVKKYVNDTINRKTETKVHEFNVSGAYQPTSTGIVIQPTNIADGTLDSERIGGLIRAFRYEHQLKVFLFDPVNPPTLPLTLRVVVFRDNNENSQVATQLDVLNSGAGVSSTICNYNWDNRSRIQILSDRCYVMEPTHGPILKCLKQTFNKTMIMKWNGAGLAANGKGRIQVLFTTDAATAADTCNIEYAGRLLFKDA